MKYFIETVTQRRAIVAVDADSFGQAVRRLNDECAGGWLEEMGATKEMSFRDITRDAAALEGSEEEYFKCKEENNGKATPDEA